MDLNKAVYYFKLAADQGYAEAQFHYGVSLRDGDGLSIDLTRASHFLKLAADQNYSAAQSAFAALLWDGRGALKNRMTAACYFRLAAEQGVADAQSHCGIALFTGDANHRTIAGAFRYLKLSAENGSRAGPLKKFQSILMTKPQKTIRRSEGQRWDVKRSQGETNPEGTGNRRKGKEDGSDV
jgi:TPR repeat protein